MAHYSLSVVGEARVAGRTVDVVAARRPGAAADSPDAARFWLDRDSGLVLRREVYDRHGRTTRASAFVEITIGRGTVAVGSGNRAWSASIDTATLDRMRDRGWHCPTVLPGPLTLVDARRGGQDGGIVHLSYSDGIATVSVFEQRGRLDEVALADHRRDVTDGHVVWVRGEVPKRVVWTSGSTVYTVVADAPERSRWTRWWRPCRTTRPRTATPSGVSAGGWTGSHPGSTRSPEGSRNVSRPADHPEHHSMTDENRPGDRPGEGAPTPWWTGPQRQVWDTPPTDDTVHDVWAPTDTLGNEPRPPRSRTGLLVALAAAIALVAGVAGGSAGFLLAERDSGSGTSTAPAWVPRRSATSSVPPAASPGSRRGCCPAWCRSRSRPRTGRPPGQGSSSTRPAVVVTNNHVVADAQGDVEVTFSNGRSMVGRCWGSPRAMTSPCCGSNAKNLPALPLGNSDSVVVGDQVVAIGSPLGLSGTVTLGIVSATTGRSPPAAAGLERQRVHQRDPDRRRHQPGQLGRPLVNLDGEVVGVNSAIATVGGRSAARAATSASGSRSRSTRCGEPSSSCSTAVRRSSR